MKALQKPPEVGEGIHLNLGCGNKVWPGFVNVDFASNYAGTKPDVECDLRAVPLPDNYADSAYAIHVLEHFFRWETEKVLAEWIRLLKPGGKLVIEVPCLDRVLGLFYHAIEHGKPINVQATMWRLYGDPGYEDPNMVHKWIFSVSELKQLMEQAGLHDVEVSAPHYHHPQADMRVTGIK